MPSNRPRYSATSHRIEYSLRQSVRTRDDVIVSGTTLSLRKLHSSSSRVVLLSTSGLKTPHDSIPRRSRLLAYLLLKGLVPKYVAKKTFGKVPPYITQKNAEMERAKQNYSDYVKTVFGARAAPVLPEVPRCARDKTRRGKQNDNFFFF